MRLIEVHIKCFVAKIRVLRLSFFLIALVSIVLLSQQSYADATCSGTISELVVHADGDVRTFPSWRNHWVGICNVNQPRLGISTQTCWTWFSLLASAKEASTLTVIKYASPVSSCSNLDIQTNSPAPLYVLVR